MADAQSSAEVFRAMLAEGPVLLSGGVGTELQRRGCDTKLPLWAAAALLDAHDEVRKLHVDYLEAGTQILTANTFRTDRRTVQRARRGVSGLELTARAVRLAREAVAQVAPDRPVLIAGSIGPLGDCYDPLAVPNDAGLRQGHWSRVWSLVCAKADLLMVETMNTTREARCVLETARAWLPACVSFLCRSGGRLLSGESLAEAARAVEPYAPLAILVNCCAPAVATEALEVLREATDRPIGVYANGRGHPDDTLGWRFEGGTPDRDYVAEARRWLEMGATLVGGCCGTSPRTIEKLAGLLRDR